jgi:multiple sugar transport system substrate-binding protein
MQTRTPALFALLTLVASLILAACGGAPAPAAQSSTAPAASQPTSAAAAPAAAEPTTISYFTFSAAPDHLKDLDQMIAAFKTANPDVDVKVETAPFDQYFTKLQTLIAGGTPPDVFELNYENFVTYASKGALADLTPLAGADAGFAKKFYPRAYEAFSRDGKQYGLPQSFSNVVLFYNKDLFDAAGVAYPTEDWTWKEELDAAQKLTDAGKGVWGEYSPIQFWEFYKTAAQSGCGVFGPDGKTVTINQPGCVEALTWMTDKVGKYKIAPTDADMAGVSDGDMFKQGKIAMLRTGIWMFSAFKDAPFKWDIALEPGNTQKAHHFFANAVAISPQSKNQQAAWKWASFFTSSPEAAKIRVAASWELPALNDQALFDAWLKQTPPTSRQVVFKALDTLVTPPVTEQQSKMQDLVNKLLDQTKTGALAPQQALDQAKTEIEALEN